MVSSSSGTPFAENSQEVKLREYVSTAFEKKAKGDTTSYDVIIKQLRTTADPLALKKWFYVLRQRVSLFSNSRRYYSGSGKGKGKEKENVEEEISTSDYNELVVTLLQFDSWDNTDLSEDFISLVSDIVCSNGCYVIPCFQVLVKNFLPKKKSITTQNSEPYDASMMQTVSDNTHRAIERLVSLVPTSTATLFDVILELFPHKSFDLCTQKSFVSNLLRLSTYCYPLRDRILALIVEKIIQLDVEIKLEEVVEDDEDEQFALELNEGEGVESLRNYIEVRQLQISDMADKLDTLMQIMFEYLNNIRQLTEEEDYEDISTNQTLDEIFHLFLRLFDCAILNTHRSKYTQFLLFYLCQFNLNYTKAFLGYLLNKLFDANGYYSSSTLLRSTCAAYIGSFIARCSLVTLPIIKSCVFELARWAESYVQAHGDSQPDAQLHDIFYSVCQALFYMICFKNKILLDNPANRSFLESLNLPVIIRSRLNPFKVCSASVVAEFSKLATTKKIMNCEEIIDRNKRIVLPTKTVYGGYNQVETFFPSIYLKNSSAYVMNHYVSWKKIADEDEDEEEDSDYEEDEDETNSNSSYLSMSVTDENSTPTKFLACQRLKEHTEDLMSYSPAFNNEISLNDLISFGRH